MKIVAVGIAALLVSVSIMAPLLSNASLQQKQDSLRNEELEDYYKKWLDQDVLFLITDEERGIFLNLTTEDERDNFIEQFWRRRDEDPETIENDFREEHYRRMAYANDHYSIGVPGWKSDRGRVYIINGPPDSIEVHDQGEQYYRPSSEGRGVTTTYAWELWWYRTIEGIGDDVEIEFVDKTMSGHYVLARDEMDKDAMLWVPGLGLTEAEQYDPRLKAERIGTRNMANMANMATRRAANPLKMFSSKDDLFERLRRYNQIQASPEIKFKDLEGVIDVQLYYNQLPFTVRYDLIRVTQEDYLVPVTFFFDNRNFTFKTVGPVEQASLNVYGRVENMTKQRVYAFDDEVFLRQDPAAEGNIENGIFQRGIPLKPGRYKLTAVVQDVHGGKIGTLQKGIHVPADDGSIALDMSPIILADRVQPVKKGEFITDPFVLGSVKVYPSAEGVFKRGKPVGFYFEVYNVVADQQTLEPDLSVDLILSKGGKEIPLPFKELHRMLHRYADRFFAGSMLNSQTLETGTYTMAIAVTDNITGVRKQKTAKFRIVG
jgi:GWxTD domain-containing protein